MLKYQRLAMSDWWKLSTLIYKTKQPNHSNAAPPKSKRHRHLALYGIGPGTCLSHGCFPMSAEG